MRCREARQLFSTHLDGELTPAEDEALRVHLAECRACAAEFGLEREVCAVLRESAAADPLTRVPRAPAGFARGVTAALEERRRGRRSGLTARWRHGLAAAAALVLIATASLGYGVQQWLGRAPVIAHNDPPGPSGELTPPGSGPVTPGTGAPDVPGGEGTGADPGSDPGGAAGGETDPGTDPEATPAGPDREPGATQIASGPDVEQKVFLNKPRSIESTLLKVNVQNLAQARDKAIMQAGNVGASLQTQVAQTGATPAEVLRFNVDPAGAGALANQLAGLGRVADRQSDSRDITGQFADALEQYQALVAQRNRVADPDERATLDGRIASLEQWLIEKDREAGRHIIVLVLQEN